MPEEYVQINIRIPTTLKKKLDEHPDSQTVVIRNLLEDHFYNSKVHDILHDQLIAKDRQIAYLQSELEKSNTFMKEILEDYNRQSVEYIDNFKPMISSINDALQSRQKLLEHPQKKKSKWKFWEKD